MNKTLIEKMKKSAGYRENYAIENGTGSIRREGEYTLITFTYSEDDEYQDANGATYCIERSAWIG